MAQTINNVIKSLPLISITSLSEIKSYNEIGERSVADTYITDREGTLSLTFKAITN